MIESLSLARFSREDDVNKLDPMTVLHAALSDPDLATADHVIVVHARIADDGSIQHGWLQGGKFNSFAQIGLLARIQQRFVEAD